MKSTTIDLASSEGLNGMKVVTKFLGVIFAFIFWLNGLFVVFLHEPGAGAA